MASGYFLIFTEEKLIGIVCMLYVFPIALSSKAKGYDTKSVFLTSETISAELKGETIKEDSLDNFELLLAGHLTGRHDYRYQVFIRRKGANSRDILLVEHVTNPTNLREWVEGLQNQLKTPLPVKFSEEQVERDYETGLYKSKKKRSV
ncbi:MAG: hypothetical protein KDI46_08990 [Alphaproteobacteria bacterium]|nr:hypothetical protein [Alphaproteobacteria bacterium]